MRKNLVIVRAGDQSLHPTWLAATEDRNWDILVSYFGDDPERFRGDDIRRIDSKGPKWPALNVLMQELADDIGRYEYVWLPDDDLACDTGGINRLFDFCHQYDLELAQPALSPDSYANHAITVRNRSFLLRFTTFVEIMAPCFSASFLRRCAHTFGENKSGYGLEYLWPHWASATTKVAIIDNVIIRHTRRIGGPNQRLLVAEGTSAGDELLAFLLKYEIRTLDKLIIGAIDHAGRRLSISDDTHAQLVADIIAGYLPEFGSRAEHLIELIKPSLALLPPATWTPTAYTSERKE
jgi:hypothetical protein